MSFCRCLPSLLFVLFLAACGRSAALEAAHAGDVERLRASLEERGDVDVDEARDIAEALLTGAIEGARGRSGRESLEAMGSTCLVRFDDSLARRGAHDDELAAKATLLRIDAGLLAPLSHVGLVRDERAYWRAVGARSLGEPFAPDARGEEARQQRHAALWRRRLIEDPSSEVREAALHAAAEAGDPRDVPAVLEAARLDPAPESRRVAITAAGAIGTREAVMGLRDMWAQADEETRLAIVEAWKTTSAEAPGRCAHPPQAAACIARHQLRRISESDEGMESLAAALALLEGVAPGKSDVVVDNAAAVVERLIDDASTRVRVRAIEGAPLSWASLLEAIVDASSTPDERVKAAALGRMSELGGDERTESLKALRAMAKDRGMVGDAAREALVKARDAEAARLVAAGAADPSSTVRAEAATRLAQLGRADQAAPFLADRDASVRSKAACAILEIED